MAPSVSNDRDRSLVGQQQVEMQTRVKVMDAFNSLQVYIVLIRDIEQSFTLLYLSKKKGRRKVSSTNISTVHNFKKVCN